MSKKVVEILLWQKAIYLLTVSESFWSSLTTADTLHLLSSQADYLSLATEAWSVASWMGLHPILLVLCRLIVLLAEQVKLIELLQKWLIFIICHRYNWTTVWYWTLREVKTLDIAFAAFVWLMVFATCILDCQHYVSTVPILTTHNHYIKSHWLRREICHNLVETCHDPNVKWCIEKH
jgi:hypothetical protein